jgi:hypothetical protein
MRSLEKAFALDLGNRNISGGDQPERVFTGFIRGDPMASVGVATPAAASAWTRPHRAAPPSR